MRTSRLPPAFLFILVAVLLTVSTIGTESQELENLRAFTKLCGYVKYFHPTDEASQIDWDRFAIYGAERVKDAQNSEGLRAALQELFLPIAPTIQIYRSEEPRPLILPEDTEGLKVVAWQHLGVKLGSSSNIYRSIRLNRETRISSTEHGFGTVTQSVDATAYRGKEIKLKAYVRTKVSGTGNQGQLWLRVDREKQQRGFFDNMQDRPIQSRDWQSYEIVGRVADDATRIVFGCFLYGMGQVWVDGFQLFTKREDGGWNTIQIQNAGFEVEAGGRPKMWFANSPGYEYKVVSDDPHEGEHSLLIENQGKSFSGTLFDRYPEVGEVVKKKLGIGLSCQVPLALYSNNKSTLGQVDKTSFEVLLERLSEIDTGQLTANNEFVRLGDIVIAWNVFQHFYPYFEVVGTDWDAQLTNSLEEALSNQNEEDFSYTLRRLVAKLHDGHGRVRHKRSVEEAGLPFVVGWIENQVVITVSKDPTYFKVGDIVASVDGIPAEQVLLNAEEYISGSPQWRRVNSLRRFGYGKEGTTAELQLLRDDQKLTVQALRDNEDRLSEPGGPKLKELEQGIFYVDLTKTGMDEITKKINELANAKGVIFNLRGYPKGNHEVISHLLREPDTSGAWMRVPQIIYPDREDIVGYTEHGWHMQPKEPHIKGKVVFLTDGRAISYAESFMGFIEHYQLAEIVGQPTAGTNGNVNPFILPGGFRVTWTGMRVLKHDGSQHHLIGIQPTVPVQRTIQGVKEGRDEFIEKALEIIRGG